MILVETSSWSWALLWSKDPIILAISSRQKSKDESFFRISKFVRIETVLLLNVRVHCLLMKVLNRLFTFSKNSVGCQVWCLLVVVVSMRPSSWYLQMLSKLSNTFWGWFGFICETLRYFNLKELMVSDISCGRVFKKRIIQPLRNVLYSNILTSPLPLHNRT